MYVIKANIGYLVKWSKEDNNYTFSNDIQDAKKFDRLCDCKRVHNRMINLYNVVFGKSIKVIHIELNEE